MESSFKLTYTDLGHFFDLLILFVVLTVCNYALIKICRKACKKGLLSLFLSLDLPLKGILVFLTIVDCLEFLDLKGVTHVKFRFLLEVRELSFIGGVFLVIWRWPIFYLKEVASLISDKKKKSDLTILSKISKILASALLFVGILDIFHVSWKTLASIWGVVGVSLALSARDVITHFFASLALYIARPFQIGDKIKTSDGKVEGVVKEIGWYTTLVVTSSNYPTYIPNAILSNAIVMNPTRLTSAKVSYLFELKNIEFHVLSLIVEDLKRTLSEDFSVDKQYPQKVIPISYDKTLSKLKVEYYSKVVTQEDFERSKEDLLWKISQVLRKDKIAIYTCSH